MSFPSRFVAGKFAIYLSLFLLGNGGHRAAAFRRSPVSGRNVCLYEVVPFSSPLAPLTFSRVWSQGEVCSIKTIHERECCPGFDVMPGQMGCLRVKPADAMISTLISNNASIFARHLAESGLRDQLEQDGAFTVFAPNDQTMRTISVSQLQQISSARKPTEVPFLLYHLAPTRVKLEDGAVIKTSLADRTLRINRQRHDVLTVNCVPLERTYVMAKEGVMHLLSKPLDPSPTFNLMDTILGDERLQTFATLIVQAQLAGDFRDDGPFTIFAPTQDAFSSLPGNFFESILYNTDAIKALVQYHTVSGVICSSTMVHSTPKIRSLEGEGLSVGCNGSERTINDARIIRGDVMANNGFIHLIDKVLIPQKANSLWNIASAAGLTTFLSLLTETRLDGYLRDLGQSTIFIPHDNAFSGLDPELFTALRTDPNRLWQLLQEHIVDGKYTTANVIDDQVLRTRAGTELRLRLRKDAKTFTVNTARVIDTDNEGLSGIIHVVDSILYKPSLTIGTFLRNHGNFSSFIQGLSSAGVMSRLSSEPGPFTVFALPDPDPSDDNVEYLTLWRILQSPEYIGHIINNHVVEGFIPLKGLEEHYYYEISNLNKEPLILLKDGNITSAGIADVIEPDILATNGVVHIVNRIIQRVY